MKPSKLALILKKIASKIEASKQPKRDLVVRDLKNVISSMDEDSFEFQSEDFDEDDFLDKLANDPEWARFETDLYNLHAKLEDIPPDDLKVNFPPKNKQQVIELIGDARKGFYGLNVKHYWMTLSLKKKF